MARGRPPLGPKIARHLDGSCETKLRLEVLLETLAGSCSVPKACARLGISEARLHQLRSDVLEAAAQRLQARPAGRRPAAAPDPASGRIADLERQVQELRIQLHAAQLREEIALAMPHLLDFDRRAPQKTLPAGKPNQPGHAPAGSARSARSNDRSSDT